jgi:hypothetical protein
MLKRQKPFYRGFPVRPGSPLDGWKAQPAPVDLDKLLPPWELVIIDGKPVAKVKVKP